MYPDPKLITRIGQGSLSIMSKPASGEYLVDDLQHLRNNGCTHLVSLLEPQEASELTLASEQAICEELGIHFTNLPVPDRSTPADPMMFISSVLDSYKAISDGGQLIAHCRAGIGRSGIYTTSILIRHGHSAEEAFELVSIARGFRIPDTQTQIDWINEHEERIRDHT